MGEKRRRCVTFFEWRWRPVLWGTGSSFPFVIARSRNIHVVEPDSLCWRSVVLLLICCIDPFFNLRQRSWRWNDYYRYRHCRKAFGAIRHVNEGCMDVHSEGDRVE
jgi:hypothetical protein